MTFDSLIDGVFDACCQVGIDGSLLGCPLTKALSLSLQAVVLEKQDRLLLGPCTLADGELAEKFISGSSHEVMLEQMWRQVKEGGFTCWLPAGILGDREETSGTTRCDNIRGRRGHCRAHRPRQVIPGQEIDRNRP